MSGRRMSTRARSYWVVRLWASASAAVRVVSTVQPSLYEHGVGELAVAFFTLGDENFEVEWLDAGGGGAMASSGSIPHSLGAALDAVLDLAAACRMRSRLVSGVGVFRTGPAGRGLVKNLVDGQGHFAGDHFDRLLASPARSVLTGGPACAMRRRSPGQTPGTSRDPPR